MLLPARSAFLAMTLAATTLPVAANDFTGAYIGLNAGYAWSKGDRQDGVAPSLPSGAPDAVSRDLPPSAARAAGTNPSFGEPRAQRR